MGSEREDYSPRGDTDGLSAAVAYEIPNNDKQNLGDGIKGTASLEERLLLKQIDEL